MARSFTFTAHALEELKERLIPKAVVVDVLEGPEQVVPASGARVCYQSRVKMAGKTYLIRVIVDENVDPTRVITAYRTSKIKRYWSAP